MTINKRETLPRRTGPAATGTPLPRRTLLRGLGAGVALPLLEAMAPGRLARAGTSRGTATAPARLSYVFLPMGCDQSRWTPPGKDERLGQLPPILRSLEPVKSRITVLTNLELRCAYPGSHATSNASFLSCATAKHTESSDFYLGITVDQLAAQRLGRQTQLPSLELSMDMLQTIGECDNGYACVYQNNLSWSGPTTPLPPEAHPRIVFEKLFGEGGSVDERRVALRRRASLLDAIAEDLTRLERGIGVADRARVGGYLESVREIERRIQKAETDLTTSSLPADLERPLGVPTSFAEHARLMFDLQVLALQGDITRICTFQLARETSNRTYPEAGVPDAHHPVSHHGNDPGKIARLAKINEFHTSLFAYYLGRLAATREGEHSLLDRVHVLFGSGIGNPNIHDHTNLPIIVAGGAGFQGGRHVRYERPVPLANLHLTLLDRVGVRLDSFGDSTGRIDGLYAPG